MASIGRKRRFLLFGALNVALTNLLLQLLLWCGLATGLATLLSQLLNLGLGYLLYGVHVFRVASLQGRSALAYAALALLLWGLNWGGIQGLAGLAPQLGCPGPGTAAGGHLLSTAAAVGLPRAGHCRGPAFAPITSRP